MTTGIIENYQYPQMVMNWGVYLTLPDGQGGVQQGQGLYSDPWSSPVSTVNSVNTVTSLLKNGQSYFGNDAWSSIQLNGINPVSIIHVFIFCVLIRHLQKVF